VRKRIAAVVQIQNEADIIESLCRYYCSFCDGILVTDNMSSDNTRNILNSLIEEGLPVVVTNDYNTNIIHDYSGQYLWAIDVFNADILLPIDADEFLVNVNGGNPRSVLESLDETVEYHIQCRNYTCPKELKDNTLFYPSNITKYSRFSNNKTIISQCLIKEKDAKPAPGKHSFMYPENPPDIVNMKKLCYNHYPIRNVYQFMLKAILGRVHYLVHPYYDGSIHIAEGWHWKAFYDEIKKHGTISHEMLEKYSAYTGISLPEDGDYKLFEHSFDTSFCHDELKLRYTNYGAGKECFFQMLTTQLERNLLHIPSWRPAIERIEAGEQLGQANATIHNLNAYIDSLHTNGPHASFLRFFLYPMKRFLKKIFNM